MSPVAETRGQAGPDPGRAAAVSWLFGAVVTVLYGATAAPGLFWGDSAELLSVARTAGVAHPPGYPLYTLLAGLVVRAGGVRADHLLNL
ncbi:MAG: DUF2723 domain-containing protein, partial [Armatimonadetes bacterium]|nr:DUF2723 domain-containing protein [Armatimonadota bacterium]